MSRRRAAALAAALALAGGAQGARAAQPADACAEDAAVLRPAGGGAAARFSVEIADDPAERARGLMGRRAMPADHGMLFVFETPRPVAFWMKDTPLPLDILFIDARGVVTRVHERATPFSETPLPSGGPAAMTLEINAGLARRLGLGPGAQLRHPRLDQTRAAWPCAAPDQARRPG
ncbi:DUF192 domain-containing protein [Oceanicella actignis]|uniref:DUF192 domain-containing protein n=1 Tax=Oceanicella actignis TaxID=1189325 RepID=A0A1M7SAN7_9RHOB|nr:DUF192 domain-containing protein [Oceanicella actignis]SET29060.1 hypothetical protein SAMN04488119_103368 [Oceanicella actignis]SHN55536.1 hypothetical protein SAMN05216200_102140 [Oceanicella actignis]